MSEARDGGYILLFRKFQKHPIWLDRSEKFDKRSAWLDIIFEARYSPEPTTTVIDGHIITVHRGEVCYSYKTWGERWRWHPSSVRRWFAQLEKLGQIRRVNERKTTRLIVCNYDTYQPLRRDGDELTDYQPTTTRQTGDTQPTPTEESNKGNEGGEGNWLAPLYSQFKAVHPECSRVNQEQFNAKVYQYRFQHEGKTYDPDVSAALEDFTLNCASMVSFGRQGVMQKWGNYLQFTVDRQLETLKKNNGAGKRKIARVSL